MYVYKCLWVEDKICGPLLEIYLLKIAGTLIKGPVDNL